MAKLWRVTCIWIFCVSCLFERIQLPTVTAAIVPFDYFEDHEQLSYDLDTEQSKAKYDTRLLSEQLLKEQNSAESSHARPHGGGGGGGTDGNDADEVNADVDDDLQPHERAASCYNNGRKYTHGQKVPRQDACEVCLCMDGEIFCWWELCADKKSSNQPTSTHRADSHLSASTASFAERTNTMQPTFSTQQQFGSNTAPLTHFKKPAKQHATKSLKMKSYLQQQQQKLEQQKQQQKHAHKHTHAHASLSPSSASSKILNFPENLPSVLYHDYRTEEHQHHQHQHHQQHLKRQQQQRLLHQQQLLLQQQQQQQQEQQQHMQHDRTAFAQATAPPSAGDNENVSDETETDSDILPEPPTKKPKVTATTATTTTTTATLNSRAPGAQDAATATSSPTSQGVLTDMVDGHDVLTATHSDDDDNSANAGSQKSSSESAALKLALPQQSAAADSLAIANQPVGQQPASNRSSSGSSEENQDDYFHRWLASPETNNNDNNSSSKAAHDATRNADLYGTAESQNSNTTTAGAATTNASFPNVGRHAPQADSGVYFRSSYNDYSSEFNGSVVNIDILLTTADDRQQQQQSRQQQQPHRRVPSSLEADLMANHSSRARTTDNSDNGNRATAPTAAAIISSPSPLVTSTPSPSRQCNVMGTLYKIGDVLPQDTGNCLQCVCIDDSTSDDTPRVTCSPHNCPPLVLPDLFDATGY